MNPGPGDPMPSEYWDALLRDPRPVIRPEPPGLSVRALSDTIDATAAGLAARDNAPAWTAVLTAAAERELLAMAAPAGAQSRGP